MNIMGKASELIKERKTFALATVIRAKGSTPRSTAAKMIILPDGAIYDTIGGGLVEALVIEEAVKAIREGKPRILNYKLDSTVEGGLPMHCGGDMDIFIDVYRAAPHVIIAGGGHVGLALSKIISNLGWDYSIVEERVEFSDRDRFPNARGILTGGDIKELEKLQTGMNTFIVIATKDHDSGALKAVACKEAAYIGMIGSKRKVAVMKEELLNLGIPKEHLDKVHAPIGLDIGAETPEEIAISIAAEMIKIRRGHDL